MYLDTPPPYCYDWRPRPLIRCLLLYERDEHHQPYAYPHGNQLQQRLPNSRVGQQLWNDGHRCYVDEPPCREREYPRGGRGPPALHEEAARCPSHGPHGSPQLEKHGLLLGEPRLHQDGEVANLVGHLVEQDGQGGDEPHLPPGKVGGADGESVSEVVRKVGREVEVGGHLDGLGRWGGRRGAGAGLGGTSNVRGGCGCGGPWKIRGTAGKSLHTYSGTSNHYIIHTVETPTFVERLSSFGGYFVLGMYATVLLEVCHL